MLTNDLQRSLLLDRVNLTPNESFRIKNLYKILLIGESNSGKTSLLMRFIENKFEASINTIGMDYKKKIIQVDQDNYKI